MADPNRDLLFAAQSVVGAALGWPEMLAELAKRAGVAPKGDG